MAQEMSDTERLRILVSWRLRELTAAAPDLLSCPILPASLLVGQFVGQSVG